MRHVYQHAGAPRKVLLAGGLLQQQLVMLHRYQLDSHSHTGIEESRHDLLQQQIVMLQHQLDSHFHKGISVSPKAHSLLRFLVQSYPTGTFAESDITLSPTAHSVLRLLVLLQVMTFLHYRSSAR